MNKALKIYLFSFAALIVLMIAIDQSRPKPLDWTPSYRLADKIPLGLYVLDNEIDGLMKDSVARYDKTFYEYYKENDSTGYTPKSYLFVSNYIYFDKESLGKLLDAVEKGSSAFISSAGFQTDLSDTLQTETDYKYIGLSFDYRKSQSYKRIDTIQLTLSNRQRDSLAYNLSPVFGQTLFSKADTTTTVALGYMIFPDSTKYLSFIRVKRGKGNIFLHNQPSVFANYSLLSGDGLQQYVANALSYLPEALPVVWFVQKQTGSAEARTPLAVIFKYPALRMVWLIFVYGLLLFVFFTAKRRQRVIPVIKPLRNTTVEFAQTIGNLYFQEGDTTNIARKKIIYFLDRIRQTYHIDTQSPDDAFVQRLHLKSGKDMQTIRNTVNFIRMINEKGECSETGLTLLNEYIEKFWDGD